MAEAIVPTSDARSSARSGWPFVAVPALALLLRSAIATGTAHAHPAHWFFDEATELGCLATSLLTGHGLSSPFGGSTGPSAFLAPGYPAFVAAVFRLAGPYTLHAALLIMLMQSVFAALTVFALMRLTQRLGGRPAALLAGLVWTLSPPLLFMPTVFWDTTFSTLMVVSLVLLAIRCAEATSAARWVALSACAVLALAVNPSLLTVAVACIAWALWRTHARPRTPIVLTLFAAALVLSLWPIRNGRVLHAFIPLRPNLGYELWQGNRPGSDGFFDKSLHPNNSPAEFERYRQLGEVAYMREKGELAHRAIAADKPRFLRLTVRRTFSFWTGIGPQSTGLMDAYAILSSVFGLWGLWLLWRRARSTAFLLAAVLLLFPLPYYITHPDFRFRSVIDPLTVALAACALTGLRVEGES